MKKLGFALVLSLCSFGLFGADIAVVSVADNATYELDVGADINQVEAQGTTGTMLQFGAGCTLKLVDANDGAGADFPLKAGIYCPSGDLVIDGTALSGYSTTLRWFGGAYVPNGTVTLKGFKKIVYGKSFLASNVGLAVPSLGAKDILFDPADGSQGVEFVYSSAQQCRFATCPWTVRSGSTLWFEDEDTLVPNAPEDTTFVADGWNFGFAMGYAVSYSNVMIRGGDILYRHCVITTESSDRRKMLCNWAASSQTAKIKSNLILDGSDTSFLIYSNASGRDHEIAGDVSGDGKVALYASSDNKLSVSFNGAADWTGETWIRANNDAVRQGCGTIIFRDPSPATSCIRISNETAGAVRFRPEGYGEAETAVAVNAIACDTEENATVFVEPKQTLTVGEVSGHVTFSGDASGKVVVGSLAAGATIRLVGDVRLQVLASADAKAKVTLGAADDTESGSWELSGPSSGTAVSFSVTEVVPGGTVAFAGCVAGALADFSSISSKIALWCDASAQGCFETIEDKTRSSGVGATTAEGYPYLWSWKDCRPEQTTCWFGNKRYYPTSTIGVNSIFGCLAAGTDAAAPNGKPYVKTAGSSGHFNIFENANGKMTTTATISAAYAIVVYGSQVMGGGAAILGNQDAAFYRKAKGESWNATTAALTKFGMTYLSYAGAVDGTETDLSVAKLNGGWQIISFNPDGATVQGLGFSAKGEGLTPDNRGGCNYAEVMLFSETPTDIERKIAEERLSEKWGIPVAHEKTSVNQTLALNMTGDATTPVLTESGTDSLLVNLTVDVNFPTRPKSGRYPLIANAKLASVALGTVTGNGKYEVKLSYDADAEVLYADVTGPGLTLILK